MTDETAQNVAQPVAKFGVVTVEDEPVVKTCSGCSQSLPRSSFSGAQLKLKGKRKCKACIQLQQQANEAQSVSSATVFSATCSFAASAAASASASASSSAKPVSPQQQPPSTAHSATANGELPSSCSVCSNQCGELRTCSRCTSAYCCLLCLKAHKDSELCEAMSHAKDTLPPLDGIADEDRLSVAELAEMWPPLQRACMQRQELTRRIEQQELPEYCSSFHDLTVSVAELAPLVELYPPRLDADAVWWSPHRSQAHSNATDVVFAWAKLFAVLRRAEFLSCFLLDSSLPGGWGRRPLGPPSPAFSDGRLIHRLLVHAIYFFRHVDPQLLPEDMQAHIHAQSDEHGDLPLIIDPQTQGLLSLSYLSSVDPAGRRLLLPFVGCLPLPRLTPPLCAARSLECGDHRKLFITSGPDGALVREAGVIIVSGRTLEGGAGAPVSDVTAVAGWTADRFTCASSELSCTDVNDTREQEEVGRASIPWRPHCALIDVMRDTLEEQWPQTGENLFIAIPRRGLETELTELLMLESLKGEADTGDAQAQLLLDHLVEESGAAGVSELIEVQRSRVEEMQQWQQEQLRLHAEAVERAEQRTARRRTIKGAPIAAPLAAAATGPPTDERKQAFSSSASVSQLASASAAKAANGHGNLVHNASSELTPTHTFSATELACSWTADAELTGVASLLQTGRRKFDVIVKTALKFLHSLHPISVTQSGSHRVFHFAQSGPVTLVIPHAGRRSKDSTVSRQYCTRLYEAMAQATMSQFGPMHAAAQVEQAQPPLQLKADSSSMTALDGLD
jgi:hypothetical protein